MQDKLSRSPKEPAPFRLNNATNSEDPNEVSQNNNEAMEKISKKGVAKIVAVEVLAPATEKTSQNPGRIMDDQTRAAAVSLKFRNFMPSTSVVRSPE